jgi:heme/copper-type cytochrome/quinol oxidase subunit 4
MRRSIPPSASLAWAVLVILTVASWAIGSGHGVGRQVVGSLVLVLAAVKAIVVSAEFMELRGAPRLLRLAVHGELVAGTGALVGLYLVGFP